MLGRGIDAVHGAGAVPAHLTGLADCAGCPPSALSPRGPKKGAGLLAVTLLAAFPVQLAAFPVQIEPDSGLFANVFYHVACLSESIGCSKAGFERFWRERLGWDETDAKMLDDLKFVLDAAGDTTAEPEPIPYPPNFGSYYPGIRARQALLVAALESGSATGARAATENVLSPAAARRLASVFVHFESRLRPWWESRDATWGRAHERSLLRTLEESNLGDLVDRMGEFLESRISWVGLHVIDAPYGLQGSHATILGHHVFLEAGVSDKPVESVWKVLHELVHILYDRGPHERHRELVAQFIQAAPPHSMSHYVLLNEAIATALQLIVFDRLQIQMENYYADFLVRTAAQSTKPILEMALSTGSSLYDGFSDHFIQAADAAFGGLVRSPQFLLVGAAVLGMENYPKASEAYLRRVPPRSLVISEDAVRAFPETHVVRLLRHGDLKSLQSRFQLDEDVTQHRAFVYSPPRASKRQIFWICGQDEAALVAAVTAFAGLADVTSGGKLVAID